MFTGTVIKKKHYPGVSATPEHIVGTKISAFVAPLQPATPEGWSVVVLGIDTVGGKAKKHELFVDASTWSTLEEGSSWPIKGT